ncbi:hypothetical protein STVA_42630 [Allostella vacuolata]|nr:hypothetical protein STVA_42630 [Stella vacuolata]
MNKMTSIQEIEAQARQMRAEQFGRTMSAIARLALAAPRKIGAALRTWSTQRQAYDELMALDDRQLRDMGLARSEIPAVVAGTFAPDSFRVEALPAVDGAAAGANTNERKPADLRRVA